MKKLLTLALGALITTQAFSANLFSLAMDQQVNNGSGDVIYPFPNTPGQFPLEIGTNGAFTRMKMQPGGGWVYGPYVSFRRMLGHDLNFSDPTTTMTFDTRVFNASTNTNPYADANVFVRVYTANDAHASIGWRDYGIVYGPNMTGDPDKYPNWKTPVFRLNDKLSNSYTEGGGTFDPTKVAYMRFYGTDWTGKGDDYLDVKNLNINAVPEPASMIALGLGAVGLVARRRRR